MRTYLVFAALAAAVAFASLAPRSADAGPVWVATLSSNDAGSTQTETIVAKTCYCAQSSKGETCIKLTTGSGAAADCSKDFILPAPALEDLLPKAYCFDSAAKTSIVARMRDGGTVGVKLYKLEQSPLTGGAPQNCNAGAFGL